MLNYTMLDRNCKKILVRGVNWIGDAVMTMPALCAFKKALPDAKISLLAKPWVATLFENNPNVDEIILYENIHKSFLGKFKLAGFLKRKNFCSSLLFQNAFDAALIAFLAGIPQRIGYKRDFRSFLLTHSVPFNNEDRHMHHIDYYLNLLRKSGINTEYSLPYIYLTTNERLWARELLNILQRPVVGINPGAAYGSAKRWQSDKFAEVAKKIITELNGNIVIFGSIPETKIADEIISHPSLSKLQSHIVSMAGKTNLRQLSALISECDAFLTNDSGPMHIGYAVRTPMVTIFGSTDPSLTGPPKCVKNIVIKKNIACSPCFKRTCDKPNILCMDEIKPDEIFQAIKTILPDNKAVFFDRDGTLCEDANYLNKIDDLKIFDEISNLNNLKDKGFKIIGISNQSGIARGIVKESFTKEVNNIFIKKYGFNDFYYCPHHPDEKCSCRKPEPEMVFKARDKHNIDLKKSFVIGDKEVDIQLAKNIGAKGILVLTGQENKSSSADYIAKDLKDAVKWILDNS
jgi:heptosyltransferase-2